MTPRQWPLLIILLSTCQFTESRPLYMWNEVGRASFHNFNANSLHRLSRGHFSPTFPSRKAPLTIHHRLVPLLDILEPLETIWEFYCNRDDIMMELLQQSATFVRKNSVKTMGYLLIACSVAQALALVGVIGDRGEGLKDWAQDWGIEKVLQKTAAAMTDIGIKSFRQYRKSGNKSKFAVAVSVGALFSSAAVNITTLSVKALISSFLILEGLSFAGFIGEPGESFMESIDSHDNKAEWVKQTKQLRSNIRKYVSWDALETFYEAAVDEEKVACAGFAIGSLMAMFT